MHSCLWKSAWVTAILVLFAFSVQEVDAQLIALKTVPVATGDQFLLFPSANLGMGSVGIVIDDSVADPFVNPGKGARIREAYVFAAPTHYAVTNNAGNASSLSTGALFKSSRFLEAVWCLSNR